jgi:hydrogenase small subunit
MADGPELSNALAAQGFSRRAFLKYCVGVAAMLGLPAAAAGEIANALGGGRRRPLLWLSFQECTACTESLTRSYAPTFESLIFDFYSLDYHHTLQAAAGDAAEAARIATVAAGGYLLVVEGSVPSEADGACSTIAGRSSLDILAESAAGAEAVIAIGSCAAFGGLPAARPNPTAAHSVETLMTQGKIAERPLVNLPGCPPIPEAIAATLAHFVTFERLPRLDALHRPLAIYGNTVHDRCSRVHFFYEGLFAESFDDEGARKGWCLYHWGCKGPLTHNGCSTSKWNEGTASPIDAGHPCIGCSEPDFWDQGPIYRALAAGETAAVARETEAMERGRELFDSNCIYCHEPDATGFKTPLDALQFGYAQQGGRAHRVQLDGAQWADLVKYLEGRGP